MIDLGGGTGAVGHLNLDSDPIGIANGTLAASVIRYSFPSLTAWPVIGANLTGLDSELHLVGSRRGIQVDGSISGSINLGLWGGSILTAPAQHTGETWFGYGGYSQDFLAGNGAMLQASAIRIYGAACLDNRLTNIGNRISDTAPLEINGGRIAAWTGLAGAGSERVGPIHVTGHAKLELQGAFTLSAPSLTRDPGTLVSFNADPALGRRIIFDQAPALRGGILPYAGQVTYDTGADALEASDDVGIRALTAGELTASIPAAGATGPLPNVFLSAQQTVTGDVAVNSVAGEMVLLDNANLHVESGYLGSRVSGTGTITAPDELIVAPSSTVSMTVPVTAKSLILQTTARMHVANNLTDRVVLSEGDVFINHPGALGSAKLYMSSFNNLFVNDTMTLPNDVQVGPESPPHIANTNLYLATTAVHVPIGKTLTLTGHLTGDTVSILADGRLRLDGNVDVKHLMLSALESVEVNGTIAGEAGANGAHDAQMIGDLFGNGTIIGIYGQGTVSPGPSGSTGRLTIETMTSFTYHSDINGQVAGESYDQLVLLSRVFSDYSGYVPPVLDVDVGYSPLPGTEFLILDNRGTAVYPGLFAGLPQGAAIISNGVLMSISYTAGDGNDVMLKVVPEPTLLMPAAAFGLLLARRRPAWYATVGATREHRLR